MFLSAEEIKTLTGFQRKARQVEQLRRMGIPFFVSAGGRPVVTRTAVEGRREMNTRPGSWSPDVAQQRYAHHEVLGGTSTNR